MPISWNEIRSRALTFSREWATESREHAEAKSFWDEFFKVFGLSRRHLASFEEPVKNIRGHYSFIDLFWKAILIAEHKSRGEDLGKAHSQAMEYVQDLAREGRSDEVPQYVIVSDFARIALHDLVDDSTIEFPLSEFHLNVSHFGFIAGYRRHKFEPEDPINIQAVRIMGDLHDSLEGGGYSGHDLERLLVRILFCLFAEDTGIFDRDAFTLFLQNHTNPDGSDLGPQLARLFQVLNTPNESRQKNLLEELAALPYVNGELYAESLSFAEFNSDMRNRLLACTKFDWSRISPAVFGSLFQSVMEPVERRQIGAHYTSERDILKVIGPLFLDDLKAALEKAGNDAQKLKKLHDRLADLRLLDPACGCGNFLVVSYRELRLLELEIVRRLSRKELDNRNGNGPSQRRFDVLNTLFRIDVHQFYGIEIEEWPARIAEVAMWLMDHQMNQRVSEEFGEYFVRLPLRKSPHIHLGNALRIDWNELLPAKQCSYVMGNPPFVGAKYQSKSQRKELAETVGGVKSGGLLDYVTGWYFKAARFIQGTSITVAFVSTNSIAQGEQVGVLWPELLKRYGVSIFFAHRTFAWESEARGKAHVHVVIVGFGVGNQRQKKIYDYETLRGEPTASIVSSINPYLIEGPSVTVLNRSTPLCVVPEMQFGNQPIDGGHLILTPEERHGILTGHPELKKFIRPFLGSREFINSIERWCLWLKDADPELLRSSTEVMERITAVREFRLRSNRAVTKSLAKKPNLFAFVSHTDRPYLLIPSVSSERRRFIPMGFMKGNTIASNLCLTIPGAKRFHFGILSSTMHMAWVRQVAGRLKSDFRYSAKLVYNNFPWPQDVSDTKHNKVEEAAQAVLDAREAYPDCSLADLYDPLVMPANLVKAHAKLDRAVDRCYRTQPFANERNRVEYLFNLYQKLTAPLLPDKPGRRKKQ